MKWPAAEKKKNSAAEICIQQYFQLSTDTKTDFRIGIDGLEYPFSSTFLPSGTILRCGANSREKGQVKISAFQQAEFFTTAEIFTSLFSR